MPYAAVLGICARSRPSTAPRLVAIAIGARRVPVLSYAARPAVNGFLRGPDLGLAAGLPFSCEQPVISHVRNVSHAAWLTRRDLVLNGQPTGQSSHQPPGPNASAASALGAFVTAAPAGVILPPTG